MEKQFRFDSLYGALWSELPCMCVRAFEIRATRHIEVVHPGICAPVNRGLLFACDLPIYSRFLFRAWPSLSLYISPGCATATHRSRYLDGPNTKNEIKLRRAHCAYRGYGGTVRPGEAQTQNQIQHKNKWPNDVCECVCRYVEAASISLAIGVWTPERKAKSNWNCTPENPKRYVINTCYVLVFLYEQR